MSLVLYGSTMWASPYVFSCYVALKEKRLPFEMRLLNMHEGEQRTPEYVRLSLTGRLPALLDGEFALSESSAIVEYLDEKFPEGQRLLPAALRDRARARQLMAWIRSDLAALRADRSSQYVFFPRESLAPVPPLTAAGARAAQQLVELAGAVVTAGPLFGEWSVADADLALMLQRLLRTDYPVPPRLAAYATQQWARPSIVEWLGESRPAWQEPA